MPADHASQLLVGGVLRHFCIVHKENLVRSCLRGFDVRYASQLCVEQNKGLETDKYRADDSRDDVHEHTMKTHLYM